MSGKKTLYCGVDLGSTWVKAVGLDPGGEVVARSMTRTGMSFEDAARKALEDLAKAAGEGFDFRAAVATGYGRRNLAGVDGQRTEISCHARGALHHFDGPFHVVDVGGQDNKIIHVFADGAVDHFVMNRKCAAGTGAFIEEIARRLDIPLDHLETLAESADADITLSSFCTVFSATEVIQRIREGQSPANISRGIFNSVAARVAEMAPLTDRIVFTGGVAQAFPVVAGLLEKLTGAEVMTPPYAQHVGALGAALYARDLAEK